MLHEIWFAEGLAHIRASGEATAEGYEAVAADLVAASEWKRGISILVDYRDLNLGHLSPDGIRELARAVGHYRQELGNGLCAIVTPHALAFGIGRMWEVYMQDFTDLHVGVFYNMEEAKQWLSTEGAGG